MDCGGKESKTVIVLRLLGCVSCLSAAVLMATSHDSFTIPTFNITLEAKFQYTPAFRFLVAVNAVVGVCSLLVLFVPPTTLLGAAIIPFDLLAALLLTGSLGAAAAIGYVGKVGSPRAGWNPVCDQIPKFCRQSSGALAANLAGAILYALIVLHAIYSSHASIPAKQ